MEMISQYQQNKAPNHSAHLVLNWFGNHQSEFNIFPSPTQNTDLNPIEKMWDKVEKSLQSFETSSTNLTQFKIVIMSACINIPQLRYQILGVAMKLSLNIFVMMSKSLFLLLDLYRISTTFLKIINFVYT
ncbi:hypothetical protein TNCT_473881 [Trichonephila clavata]|uniref:Tc1-like transposase DDE domain-containing protein n=1 Tax=Trichonephila clavata TaxID=2740835 RepID=A0A8X6GJM6_TRICU|nr:hypothetical protein TNCT_473881 [Trichonephila clavata]